MLNDLKARGVRDVLIFSVDGLTSIEDAIRAAYPKADVQRCIVHQIRNSLRYVSWKDRKELAGDLKTVYGASTLGEAVLKSLYMAELELERKWSKPIRDWAIIYAQLVVLFEDRLS